MRVRCFLREIRGSRSLREIATAADVNAGNLSRIELGSAFPKDDEIPRLEVAYGAEVSEWYPGRVLLALEVEDDELHDLRERLRVKSLA